MEDPLKRDWVSFYRPIFLNHLNVNATFLSLIKGVVASTEEADTLCNINKREKAVMKFLTKLSMVQYKDGIFQEVCNALKLSEQVHVEEMIRSGQRAPSELSLRNKHLLRQYQKEITKRVNPSEILPYLTCLTIEENSEINCCKDNHGDERGVLKMLSYLVLKGDDMLDQLLTGLRETGHGEVADQLEDDMAKGLRRINARQQPKPAIEEYYEEWKGVDDLQCCTDVNMVNEHDEVTQQMAGLKISLNNCASALTPEEDGAFGVTYTSDDNMDTFDTDIFDASESCEVDEDENADTEDIEKAQTGSRNIQKELASSCFKANAVSGAGSRYFTQPQRTSSVQLENENTVNSNGRKLRKLQKQNSLPDAQDTARVALCSNCGVKMPTIRHHPDQSKRVSFSGNGYTTDTMNTNGHPSSYTQINKMSDMEYVTTCFNEATEPMERDTAVVCFNNSELTPDKHQTPEMSSDKHQTPEMSSDKLQTPELSPNKLQAQFPKVIFGDVIDVKTYWASNCCRECTKSGPYKIDKASKSLVCKSCGARYQDKTKLTQRPIAEVTLLTKDQESVRKLCYHRELSKFFKDNGDKFTDFRSKDRLASYLKDQVSLKFEIGEKNHVSRIGKC